MIPKIKLYLDLIRWNRPAGWLLLLPPLRDTASGCAAPTCTPWGAGSRAVALPLRVSGAGGGSRGTLAVSARLLLAHSVVLRTEAVGEQE